MNIWTLLLLGAGGLVLAKELKKSSTKSDLMNQAARLYRHAQELRASGQDSAAIAVEQAAKAMAEQAKLM